MSMPPGPYRPNPAIPERRPRAERECIGVTGRLFGHAFVELTIGDNPCGWVCRRCGFMQDAGLLGK